VLPDGFGELPAVLALDAAEQPEQVALDPLPGFRTGEATAYSLVQLPQRFRPSGDHRRFGDPVLRDHDAPFSLLHQKGGSGKI
jgi:hypothetical protein